LKCSNHRPRIVCSRTLRNPCIFDGFDEFVASRAANVFCRLRFAVLCVSAFLEQGQYHAVCKLYRFGSRSTTGHGTAAPRGGGGLRLPLRRLQLGCGARSCSSDLLGLPLPTLLRLPAVPAWSGVLAKRWTLSPLSAATFPSFVFVRLISIAGP